MRRIGLWMTVVLLIAPVNALADEGARSWYLLGPRLMRHQMSCLAFWRQAPLNQWKHVATYDSEAACEYERNEAVQASRDETLRLSKTSPLPKLEIFKGAYRDSGLAQSSICVSADDPRLTSGSAR